MPLIVTRLLFRRCLVVITNVILFSSKIPRLTVNSKRAGVEEGLSQVTRQKKSGREADRHRKIRQVERQLASAADCFMEETSVQTSRTMPSTVMGDKRMVTPGSKDAPRFKSSKPEELRRFIRLMEDLWQDAGVTKDDVKKSMIGKYADQDSEEEWAAFESFDDGSWEDFKAELIANYPEAAAAERGTPARIRQLCSETIKVRLGDMPALYNFRRAFMAEAKKLKKPPAAMANRELVELFIGCLSDSLASAVLQFLGNNSPSAKTKGGLSGKGKGVDVATESSVERRPEDKYDLEDVCKAAIQVSENSQGMFSLMKKESSLSSDERGVFLLNQPVSEAKALSEKIEELEGVQALERDRLASMNKTIESRFGGLEDLMKALLANNQTHANQGQCKGDCKGTSCKTHESNSGPMQKWGKSMEQEKCFFCGRMGHFQADCEDLKEQLRVGNLKVNPEGKLRLRDGSFIPNQPAGASLKERVERHYARKPSHFYYGEYEETDPVPAAMPRYPSQYLGASDNAESRVALLEAEIELRKREAALNLKEKKLELASGGSRATNVVDLLGQLTEDEIAAIKAARSGFP